MHDDNGKDLILNTYQDLYMIVLVYRQSQNTLFNQIFQFDLSCNHAGELNCTYEEG